jgi:phage shock protein C
VAKRLTRDTRQAVLCGVAAGFGNYFGVDPVLVRIAFILLVFANGLGLLAYLICCVIMPREETAVAATPGAEPAGAPAASPGEKIVDDVKQTAERVVNDLRGSSGRPGRGQMIGGAILVVLGFIFLADNFSWFYWPHWLRFADLWPLILIAVGIAVILGAARGKQS